MPPFLVYHRADASGRLIQSETIEVPGPTMMHDFAITDRHVVFMDLPIVFDLLKHEGLCLGGSSGINVAGAIRLARDLGPGHTVVTVLCDSGARYQSRLFNPEFLRSKNLPVPDWLDS